MEKNTPKKRLRELGIRFGDHTPGTYNNITDVPGVKVGHYTLEEDQPVCLRTGVTSVIPADGNLYVSPVYAAAHTINGYGKSTGLIQINELGGIETPILLTNTLNVGNVSRAVVDHVIAQNEDCVTVNPAVGECNDYRLNHIRTESITKEMVFDAVGNSTSGEIQTGAVGAGTGMVCFGYKGGIGSASRIIMLDGEPYTIGALVLSNYGDINELMIKGVRIKPYYSNQESAEVKGSIIVILGTNIPMTHRQLLRLSRRAAFGIARTGGRCAHTSGEIVISFSNGNRRLRKSNAQLQTIRTLQEDGDTTKLVFNAVIDCVEESIIDSMFSARTVKGVEDTVIHELPIDRIMQDYGEQLLED